MVGTVTSAGVPAVRRSPRIARHSRASSARPRLRPPRLRGRGRRSAPRRPRRSRHGRRSVLRPFRGCHARCATTRCAMRRLPSRALSVRLRSKRLRATALHRRCVPRRLQPLPMRVWVRWTCHRRDAASRWLRLGKGRLCRLQRRPRALRGASTMLLRACAGRWCLRRLRRRPRASHGASTMFPRACVHRAEPGRGLRLPLRRPARPRRRWASAAHGRHARNATGSAPGSCSVALFRAAVLCLGHGA